MLDPKRWQKVSLRVIEYTENWFECQAEMPSRNNRKTDPFLIIFPQMTIIALLAL
jgi:hypothetical protein